MITEKLQIEGMSCSHCVMAVRKVIETVSGIAVCNVSIGTASITYDPAQLSRNSHDDMLQALRDQGYEAQVEESGAA